MKDIRKSDSKQAKGTQTWAFLLHFLSAITQIKTKKQNSQNACFRDSATMGFFAFSGC